MEEVEEPRLVDLGNATEVFCSGLGRVELLGSNVRFSMYVQQTGPDGTTERGVNLRIIMPIESVSPSIDLTLQTLRTLLFGTVKRLITERLCH